MSSKTIAVAGNPNVGKSTIFNSLTGMNQHTGNWAGKTVSNAVGKFGDITLVDIPGTYSLMAHSAEEEVARNFICFGNADATLVVCDATCLERNLNLVLQTIEVSNKTLVCVNLLDEAKRKNIKIDLALLSKRLGVPVVGTVARNKKSLTELKNQLLNLVCDKPETQPVKIQYCNEIETAIKMLKPVLDTHITAVNTRWLALRLIDGDKTLVNEINTRFGDVLLKAEITEALQNAKAYLEQHGIYGEKLKDSIVCSLVCTAERICRGVVTYEGDKYSDFDRKIDRIVTSRLAGYPLMICLLMLVFWLTVTGANYPSKLLSDFLFYIQELLTKAFVALNAPDWLHGIVVLGMYRVLAWVVSVMLPPMAIFFPLFTLLEDSGYLPRIAYNLDGPFRRCGACGKQALTTCMGFGCNAVGVVGCRIIDSPRERLIAILTNNFVPCNGRFPMLITVITMFFIGTAGGVLPSVLSALGVTAVILLGICMTFLVSKLLSVTLLKGVPSSFTLELPPYRRPQIGKVIVRSVFDRTLFVLGRAVAVAAPAGALIWFLANVTVEDVTLLSHLSAFLDPIGKALGMDGVILMAFILGFPANEIVIPLAIMAYMSNGTMIDLDNISAMREILVANGWTWQTAVSVVIFTLMHWPCSTTLLTVKKETGSIKWMLASALIPTAAGTAVCFVLTLIFRLIF